jgi:hypothetical protein
MLQWMNGHCITADFATETASKLYRFHYNLCSVIPVIWSAMKRSSSPQITGSLYRHHAHCQGMTLKRLKKPGKGGKK